jgi:MoaA/NifB/PqqE/SkfB family radical SAM enzyme
MNGVEDVYNESVAANQFKRFVSAAARICLANPNTWLSCVLTEDTVPQIPQVLATADELGARGVRFGVLARVGRALDVDHSYFRRVLPRAEALLLEHGSSFPKLAIESHFKSALSRLVPNDHKTVPLRFRNEGHSVLFVAKNGDVYPFPLLELKPYRLGNAFLDDLATIWEEHRVLNDFRSSENLPVDCRECESPCALSSRSISVLWTGELTGKVPCSRFGYQR